VLALEYDRIANREDDAVPDEKHAPLRVVELAQLDDRSWRAVAGKNPEKRLQWRLTTLSRGLSQRDPPGTDVPGDGAADSRKRRNYGTRAVRWRDSSRRLRDARSLSRALTCIGLTK